MPNVLRTLLTEVKRIQRSAWNLAKLPTELARAIIRSILSSPWSDRHAGGILSGLAPVVTFTHLCRSSIQLLRSSAEVRRAILTVGLLILDFLPQQFGAVCGNDSSYYSMHLRSRYLPRPSASSPLDNRAPPMANTSQVPNLEGLHHEIHGMAEQMRVMNENNARLIQLFAAANPQPQPTPPVPGIERSRHSSRSRGRSNNPAESEEARRGRSPHRDNQIRARNKSTCQKFRDLDARLNAINTGTSAPVTVDTLIKQTELPFIEWILRARISSKFKLPAQLGIYEGKNRSNGPPGLVQEPNVALGKADKYIAAEELAEAKRGRRGKDDHKRKEPETRRVEYREEVNKRPDRGFKRPGLRRPHTPPRRPEFTLPPLNAPIAQVLSDIKHEEFVKWPRKIKTDPQRRNRNKYCEFHRDHGHNTENCFQLKEQIADLIKRGYLRKYVATRPPPHSPEKRYGDNRPTAGDIQTIHGGFGPGGCSTSSRKRHARSALRLTDEEVYNLSSSHVGNQAPITFSNDDLRGLHLPHDDALVVFAVIANFNVQRILIDSGSSADILFISAFEKIKIRLDNLHPFHTPLIGFGGNTTHPLGWINLPITLGTEPHQNTVWQDFIVVDCPSPYNTILGRPTLGGIKAITSTYHLKKKFPTLTGIGEVKGD
ncbi:hypothetical protein Acr_00g0044360 [Actinidia rufa]|uniref:Reverse transcriptase domain-containing protein n=1 Tax=Actinidia rufa TaxID=165716 RepID=A0A7J0DIY9_9ERIC|nr:hypothetical protein Acr_00g0044360 [Actinidia rufa]